MPKTSAGETRIMGHFAHLDPDQVGHSDRLSRHLANLHLVNAFHSTGWKPCRGLQL